MGYELRLPTGWRSLGRADGNSPLKFGGEGEGCELNGGAPGPPVDDPDALLRESKRNYELHAEKEEGSRTQFKLMTLLPESAIGVESRTIGPGEKRQLNARIVSASAAILFYCETDARREGKLSDQLASVYRTVRLKTSPLAEQLQPQVAVLPTVAAAWVEQETTQTSAFLDVSDLRQAQSSVLRTVRLLHRASPSQRVAVVVSVPEDPGPVIQAQLEQGSSEILYQGPGRTRRIPVGE
jgi:hypothetical protein